MAEKDHISLSIKEGIISGLPIVFGYFPVAMAFGLLSKTVDVSFLDSCLFSLIVFAGASQFMALDLIKAGAATGNIILATFLLNLRHLMMSASLAVRIKEIKRQWLIFVAFGVTDETFSVTSLGNRKLNFPFLISLHTVSYLSWVAGTFVGYLVGTVIPKSVQSAMGIGLYAMFVALLIPELKKSISVLFLSVLAGAIYAAVSYFNIISSSWSIITAIIVSSAAGVIFIKDDVKEGEKV